MPQVIRCRNCNAWMQVPDNSAGKRFRCPKCQEPVTVAPPLAVGAGAPALICGNPHCGVANPLGERVCRRCSGPLPTAPGTVLHGRYRIEKLLALDRYFPVYLASDVKNGNRPVAIKEMFCPNPTEFAVRLNLFRRDAEVLRSFATIPIVPRVYDLVAEGLSAYLVLEDVRGQDLLTVKEAANNKPFSLDQVIDWTKAICDLLTCMHTRTFPRVFHHLEPANIILLEDKITIKIVHFDYHMCDDFEPNAEYCGVNAPPEHIRGRPEPRSDLYALAATMYHLATGKATWGFYTAKEIETQLNDPSAPLPADQRWFYDLIRTNLAEDVNERYFTAREIKADLEKRQVTREAACPKCQHVNKVREPYCGKCTEPLTDLTPPCHHCGKNNRMGSRRCIHCDNRLR